VLEHGGPGDDLTGRALTVGELAARYRVDVTS
jgi:hypothetical protein